MDDEKCVITERSNCAERDCELHYMNAPLRFAPEPRRIPWAGIAAFLVYLASIPAANLLIIHLGMVPVGFGQMAPAGVFAAGVAFTARDLTHRLLGRKAALAAIVLGIALSAILADPIIALASAAAFAISELMDLAVFVMAVHRNFPTAVLLSNLAGIVLDSVIFLSLAFGSLAFLPGQLIGKLWMTAIAVAILIPLSKRRAF